MADKRYGCKILLHRVGSTSYDPKLMGYWTDLRFELSMKYRQYFRYRAALVQVQNPRLYVELVFFDFDYITPNEEIKKRLLNKLKDAKARRTRWNNEVAQYKAHWNSLFSIDDDPSYIKALNKIQAKEESIIDLENQIKAHDTLIQNQR